MNVYIKGKKIRLQPHQSIGKGGEADIYDIGNHQALKLFKTADHPDYQNSPQQQQLAQERLQEHQSKLRQFPQSLPARVITPQDLVTDAKKALILGYTMRQVENGRVLMKYSERSFRQTGISQKTVVEIFQDLQTTVNQIHQKNVIIGDFNDLNVLVFDTQAYVIDADSFQFNQFSCRVFTQRFVDPLLCEPNATQLILIQPYYPLADWYAFAVMLMQCLLFVNPYGGIYQPKDPANWIPHTARPLKGISVFHPEVKYPKPAIPYQVLSDDLLHYFHQVFEQHHRSVFPRSILEKLHWKTCPSCGLEHSRNHCPQCQTMVLTPATLPVVKVVRGTVTATPIFKTEGIILTATWQQNQLQFLYYQQGEFKRENHTVVFTGNLQPQYQFWLQGNATLIHNQGQLITLKPNTEPSRLTVESCDVNEFARYWTYSGQLLRDGKLGQEYIGDVLTGQTQFWIGSQFGFGFYRAANLNVTFVFSATRPGINDQVKLPHYPGQLIATNCQFTPEKCWFFSTVQERGQTINRCAVIRADGTIEATAESTVPEKSDQEWLSPLAGKCAVGNFLFVATDDGIIRLETQNGQVIKTREFPDTESFVRSDSQLVGSPQGLYVISDGQILLLTLG